MKLRLIGPDHEFVYDWWMDDRPPAVIFTEAHVWVKGANSTSDNHMYFEQLGLAQLTQSQLTKVR